MKWVLSLLAAIAITIIECILLRFAEKKSSRPLNWAEEHIIGSLPLWLALVKLVEICMGNHYTPLEIIRYIIIGFLIGSFYILALYSVWVSKREKPVYEWQKWIFLEVPLIVIFNLLP